MTGEELREFDDSLGRCCHCSLLIFKSEDDWCLSSFGYNICHRKCDQEYMNKASQI